MNAPLLRRNADYRRWFVGDSLSAVGSAVSLIAFPLLILAVTGSTSLAGTIEALILVVRVLANTPAGVLADRVDRRRIILTGAALMILLYAALAVAVALGVGTIVAIVVIMPLTAAVGAVLGIAVDAMLKRIVEGPDFPLASGLEQARTSAITLLGAPLGGFLFTLRSFLPFAVNAASYLGLAIAVLLVRADFSPSRSGRARERQSVRSRAYFALAGFRAIGTIPAVGPLLGMSILANFAFTGMMATLVYFWAQSGVSPALIGLISTAATAGMLVGALVAGRAAQRLPGGVLVIVSLSVFVLAAIVIAIAPVGPFAVGALFVATLGSPFMNAVTGGYMAVSVADEQQGRVHAAATTLSMIAMPLAPLAAGIGLDLASVHVVLAAFAAACALALLPLLCSRTARGLGPSTSWAEG